MAEAGSETRKKSRSPSYPGIDLGAAIERVKTLFEKEGRNSAPPEAILEDWGYNPGSGGGLVALAALKKFGLLLDEGTKGTRRARLSPEAIRIIHESDPRERQKLIQEAALAPTIHSELWMKYEGRLPSDSTIRRDLVLERNFTPRGVREFIPQFRETMKFAGLAGGDSMTAAAGESTEEQGFMSGQSITLTESQRGRGVAEIRSVPIPIGGQKTWPVLQAPYPMSDEQWDELVASIRNMKSAWTAAGEPEDEDAG